MPFETWRYEPLDPRRVPVGQGPFRVWGQAYLSALAYIDRRVPKGRKAFLAALGSRDPFAAFYGQAFSDDADYDVSPLLRLLQVAADLAHSPLPRFIESRSRWSATTDARSTWASDGPSPPATPPPGEGSRVAERLAQAFNRYYRPTRARSFDPTPGGGFAAELTQVPAPMNGLYVSSTVGFVSSALELTGAKDVRFAWEQPIPDGDLHGIPVERVRFLVTTPTR